DAVHLQGRGLSNGCDVEQSRLALSATAHTGLMERCRADAQQAAPAGAAVHAHQLRRGHRILAHQLGAAPVDCTVSNTLPLAGTSATPAILTGDPKTPIFTALAGTSARLRMLHPPGTGIAQVFTLSGHVWQKTPYVNSIGNNPLSQWIGSIDNFGWTTHFDVLLDPAGGQNQVPGDHLDTV